MGVVVLTHNRRDELLRTLDKLVGLDERVPICVVDNASVERSDEIVRSRFCGIVPPIEFVRLSKNRGAAARNEGVRRLAVPYVAFCDDDTWWAPGALTRAADTLDAYPSLATVTGRVLIGPEERDDPTNARMEHSPLFNTLGIDGSLVAGFLAGACMMRRSAFLAAGGFEPQLFIGGEESLLTMDLLAAGWQLAYVPAVTIHHYPSSQRDAAARRALLLRNALWCAWLRRPWKSAVRVTARQFTRALNDPGLLGAAFSALRGLPWALAQRRVIPAHIDAVLSAVHDAPK